MYFTFQESKIWETGNPVDPNGKKKRVKGLTLRHAMKKLPKIQLGRSWVLIESDTTKE